MRAPLQVLDHHTIYRNPDPSRVSEYVAFPSIQAFPDDSVLCMCRHGSAQESFDGLVKLHRSLDGGLTWESLGPLPEPKNAVPGWRLPGGFGIAPGGDVIAHVNYPIDTSGRRSIHVLRSSDGGTSWSLPEPVEPAPFNHMGPGGNLCTLRGGTMVAVGECGNSHPEPGQWKWTSLCSH